jgi:hypothetical protein
MIEWNGLGRAWWSKHADPQNQCWDFLPPETKELVTLRAEKEKLLELLRLANAGHSNTLEIRRCLQANPEAKL